MSFKRRRIVIKEDLAEEAGEDDKEEEEEDSDEEHQDSGNDQEEDDESQYTDSEEDEEALPFRRTGRSIIWLCQEGQIKLARRRFEWLVLQAQDHRQQPTQQQQQQLLHKEVFQRGMDQNYALHEILMGGVSDTNARQLVQYILNYAVVHNINNNDETGNNNTNNNKNDKNNRAITAATRKMMGATPPSHRRTALHWAAWCNAPQDFLRWIIQGNPEALLLKDRRDQNLRTPLDILRHYYYNPNQNSERHNPNNGDTTKLDYLEGRTKSWTQHRLRLAVHMSVNRYFGGGDGGEAAATAHQQSLTPFDKNDRKETGVKPKPWFVLGVLGSLVQREMKPLAIHIMGYLGRDAKVAIKSKSKKRVVSAAATSAKRKRSKQGKKS